jgi:hypothetical protein
MPGVLGGLIGAVSAAASSSAFGEGTAEQFNAFAAMAPDADGNPGRSAGEQGTYQFIALLVTLGISISGGAFSGWIASKVGTLKDDQLFDDQAHFHGVPDEYNLSAYIKSCVETAGKDFSNAEAKEKKRAEKVNQVDVAPEVVN